MTLLILGSFLPILLEKCYSLHLEEYPFNITLPTLCSLLPMPLEKCYSVRLEEYPFIPYG